MKSAPVVEEVACQTGILLCKWRLVETDEEEEEHDNQIKAPAIWLMCTTALPSSNAIAIAIASVGCDSDSEVKMLKK